MIKKIQRNKKVNNQDKQAPKNLQELMQRYDLSNDKIENYLDYLIDELIKQKKEIYYNMATKEQKVLWRDTGGSYMKASQTVQLSERISEQNNGIVLFFQPYSNGVPQSWGFHTEFIPKSVLQVYNGGYGYSFIIPSNTKGILATKYIYISDDHLTGNDDNTKTFSIFGASVNNKDVVLTAVLGV